MSKILNKNTNGTRTRPLAEREMMQELTIGSDDYGKVKVGTDGTYDGEIALAKDSDMQSVLLSVEDNFNAYGYTKALTVEERFLETNTPNVVVDKVSEPVVFSDGLYERTENSQATLPVAPFAPTSTDELLDDKVNGLTCQSSHSKGDVVVVGNELVTNGTFDDTTSWVNSTQGGGALTLWTISGGVASAAAGYMIQPSANDLIGEEVVISYEVISYTSGLLYTAHGTGNLNSVSTTVGIHSSVGIITTNGDVGFYSIDFIGSIDNISVKLKDNIYQATEDTADMYDYEAEVGVATTLNKGSIYKVIDEGFTANNIGDYFEYIGDSINVIWTPASSSLNPSETNSWKYLGTASNMSLQNPYFQTLPQVTTQDVITLRKHKTSKVVDYHTFRGTTYFSEGYSQADVMSHYGFSQIDKNLWEDDTYEYVFVELKNSLNAGAFHPVYNAFGCRHLLDGDSNGIGYWYEEEGIGHAAIVKRIENTYETFNSQYISDNTQNYPTGYINNPYNVASCRPDAKYYDKVYLEGKGGLIPSSKYLAYAGKEMPRLLDSESNDLLSESWLEEGVEIVQIRKQPATVSHAYIYMSHADFKVGQRVQWFDVLGHSGATTLLNTGSDGYGEYFFTSSVVVKTVDVHLYVTKKQPHLLTYKSSTTTDIIGSPSNYPTDWLSHLASGKSIVGNALLVGQDGEDYVPDGSANNTILAKKWVTEYICLYKSESDSLIRTVDKVFNTTTNSVDYIRNTVDRVYIMNYQSANQSSIQSDPQKVLQVQPKAIASNSHSVYKGAMMTYAGTGKVAVGNGSNGLESRVVENSDMLWDVTSDQIATLILGLKILIVAGSEGDAGYKGIVGHIYIVGAGTSGLNSVQDLSTLFYAYAPHLWGTIGSVPVPSHNTISLDSSNSPATKWFTTLAEMEDGELALQTFSEEMVWDYDADVDNIVVIDGTSSYKPTTAGVIYRVVGGNLAGHIIVTDGSIFDMTVLSIENGQVYYNNTIETRMSIWDGNGFGSDNTFSKLTNGTSTDLNNKTIQHKVLTKRLGIYKGDI